jgi:hypothetical protein
MLAVEGRHMIVAVEETANGRVKEQAQHPIDLVEEEHVRHVVVVEEEHARHVFVVEGNQEPAHPTVAAVEDTPLAVRQMAVAEVDTAVDSFGAEEGSRRVAVQLVDTESASEAGTDCILGSERRLYVSSFSCQARTSYMRRMLTVRWVALRRSSLVVAHLCALCDAIDVR